MAGRVFRLDERVKDISLGCCLAAAALAGLVARAGGLEPVPLWPEAAPGETGELGEERDLTTAKDHLVAGRPVIRWGNVAKPTLTVYPAPRDRATGAAVVICPGGGYHILAMDLEGTEVAEWLNSIGVTAVLLKYRVPARKGRERHDAPLQDAQRALSLTRHRAAEWGVDPARIGILGFSAGAHLSAAASTRFEARHYPVADEADKVSCRPDFTVLIYPAYLTVKDQGDRLAPELTVTSNTPPTLLIQTQDDSVRVETSLFYYLALKRAGVRAEMHLYASGGHGYGLRPTSETVTTWPRRAEEWLRGLGLLERRP